MHRTKDKKKAKAKDLKKKKIKERRKAMPTTRTLYTLQDIKKLIADSMDTDTNLVDVFENGTLQIDGAGIVTPVEDDIYIFQVDEP